MLIRGWVRRGRQSEADAIECRTVVKRTSVEGRHCGVIILLGTLHASMLKTSNCMHLWI